MCADDPPVAGHAYVPTGETCGGSAEKAVYVHVGAPKTGTTYLQDILWNNREALAEAGLLYPLRRKGEHRIASLDLQQMSWGGTRDPSWAGTWDSLAARVREWSGPRAVISNELLGGATPGQAQRAVQSLQPARVHVVFTVRDLARQLVSDWQEQVKHTHTVSRSRFVQDLAVYGIDAPAPFGEMFWGLHDAVRVLGNWSAAVPPERMHVVTAPRPDAREGLLWERFASVLGIDPASCDTASTRANTSMGAAETELVRRLNLTLGKNLGRHYDRFVRVLLAETILAGRPEGARLTLPTEHYPWVLNRSKEIVAGVEAAGYNIVGDLDELLPTPPDEAALESDDVEESKMLEAAIDAIVELLRHGEVTGRRDRESLERLRQVEEELEQRRRQRIKTLVRDLSEKHPVLMRARVLWWHLVERVRSRPSPAG